MPLITWGPQIETGIQIIDAQHKRLVGIINELNEAMKEDRSNEIMAATMAELVDYTHTHFGTEMRLLSNHGYDHFDEHIREHKIFTDQIEMYRDRVDAGSRSVDVSVMEYLREWLVNHITVSDRAYVPTLQRGGVI